MTLPHPTTPRVDGELIAAYAEYVRLLEVSISGLAGFAYMHGWQCPADEVQRGKELSDRIAALTRPNPPSTEGDLP